MPKKQKQSPMMERTLPPCLANGWRFVVRSRDRTTNEIWRWYCQDTQSVLSLSNKWGFNKQIDAVNKAIELEAQYVLAASSSGFRHDANVAVLGGKFNEVFDYARRYHVLNEFRDILVNAQREIDHLAEMADFKGEKL